MKLRGLICTNRKKKCFREEGKKLDTTDGIRMEKESSTGARRRKATDGTGTERASRTRGGRASGGWWGTEQTPAKAKHTEKLTKENEHLVPKTRRQGSQGRYWRGTSLRSPVGDGKASEDQTRALAEGRIEGAKDTRPQTEGRPGRPGTWEGEGASQARRGRAGGRGGRSAGAGGEVRAEPARPRPQAPGRPLATPRRSARPSPPTFNGPGAGLRAGAATAEEEAASCRARGKAGRPEPGSGRGRGGLPLAGLGLLPRRSDGRARSPAGRRRPYPGQHHPASGPLTSPLQPPQPPQRRGQFVTAARRRAQRGRRACAVTPVPREPGPAGATCDQQVPAARPRPRPLSPPPHAPPPRLGPALSGPHAPPLLSRKPLNRLSDSGAS